MNLADAGMVLMKPRGRIPPGGRPAPLPPDVPPDDDLDTLPPGELDQLLGEEPTSATRAEATEEIPPGWGEDAPAEAAEPEAEVQVSLSR